MSSSIRLGVLTPSSNTALEPLTSAIVARLPGVTAHFSRFKVTEISLAPDALGQFDDSKILAAAELLADAQVDVIGWSGTAAGWMGFERDHHLIERIKAHTGIAATTAVLALNDLLAIKGVRRMGLVTPYTTDVQQRIVANYAGLGVEVVAERHLGICVNHDFALVPPEQLARMSREVASGPEHSRPQAITTFCTNLHAAQLAESLEAETGVTLLDTVSTTVWGMLRVAGVSPAQIQGWGQLYGWK